MAFYVCSTKGKGELVYSTSSHSSHKRLREEGNEDGHNDASTYQHFGQMNRAVVKGVRRFVAGMEAGVENGNSDAHEEEEEEEEETAIVKVLSMALNRELSVGQEVFCYPR